MNKMKKLTSVMLTLALLLGVLVMAVPFSASAYDNTKTFTINGYDKDPNELANIISRKIAFNRQGVMA